MRNIGYINGVEGVVSTGTASVNIPKDRRYHALKLFVTAGGGVTSASAIVDRVRLYVDGVVQRDLSAAQIINISLLNGITAATGEIPIFFSEPWRASVTAEEITSWDVFGGVQKITLEIVFLAVTTPACQVQAAYDYGRNVQVVNGQTVPVLAIIKQLNQMIVAPSGTFDIVNIPTKYPIQRISLAMSANDISSVEVYNGSQKIREGTKAQNARFLADYGLNSAAFTFPLVFDYEQQISSALDNVANQGDLNIRPTTTGAGTLTALIESRSPGYGA